MCGALRPEPGTEQMLIRGATVAVLSIITTAIPGASRSPVGFQLTRIPGPQSSGDPHPAYPSTPGFFEAQFWSPEGRRFATAHTRERGPLLPFGADRPTLAYFLFPGRWPSEWPSTLTVLYRALSGTSLSHLHRRAAATRARDPSALPSTPSSLPPFPSCPSPRLTA